MKRILILGSGGAGKSTLARSLGVRLGLPVVHLDAEYWQPGWRETPAEQWTARVNELIQRELWVMDGNFGGTAEARIARADAIVFLDVPRLICLAQVIRRRIHYWGRTRPDMGEGCAEKADLEFLKWIWDYPHRSKPKLFRQIAARPSGARLVHLKSLGQIRRFLNSL